MEIEISSKVSFEEEETGGKDAKKEREKAYKIVSGTEIPIDSYDEIIFELTSAGNKSITDGDILSEFNKLKSKK